MAGVKHVLILGLACYLWICSVDIVKAGQCDIGFVLDTSGSIKKPDYVKEKKFVNDLATYLGFRNTNYGVVLFSFIAEMPIKFTDHRTLESFKGAVTKMSQAGSITRIDRGLLKAQNKLYSPDGGHRPNANRVLFLLTDGTQSFSLDKVDNHLISRNIRYSGTEFFVIGVGRSVKKDELVKIAGGKERVFIAEDFDKLTSREFVDQFNMSCSDASFTYSEKYYLNIAFINEASQDATIQIESESGNANDRTSFVVSANNRQPFRRQILTQKIHSVSVRGERSGSFIPILNGQSGRLRFRYSPVEELAIVRITDGGLKQSRAHRVFVHFLNQLPYTVYLKCSFKNQVVAQYTISSNRMYHVYMFDLETHGQVTFSVTNADGNTVKINSGRNSWSLDVASDTYLYRTNLWTSQNNNVNPLAQYTYTANFQIYNIGQYNLYFQYQQNEFNIAQNSDVSRSITTVGSRQPAPIKLYVRRDGDTARYFVLDIMPTREGAHFKIVIGNDFDYYLPRSFKINYYNYVINSPVNTRLSVAKSTLSYDFVTNQQRQDTHVYMVYAKPEPSFTVNGDFTQNGAKKPLFVNGKPQELIGVTEDLLSKDIDVHLSGFKLGRKRFWGIVENKVNSDIILHWEVDKDIQLQLKPPGNDKVFARRSTRNTVYFFWNYQDMQYFYLTAWDKNTKKALSINGRPKHRAQLVSKRPNPLPRLIISAPGAYYYLAYRVTNELSYTVYLHWRTEFKDAGFFSTSPTKYEIKPNTKDRIIKMTFTSERKLTSEELKQATSLVTGTSFDGKTPVFVNDGEVARVPVTSQEGQGSRIWFSKHVSQYYITVDIENTLSSPVTLNLKSNIADLDFQQKPSKMSYTISPSIDSQVLSFTFSTASENGFKDVISNFITFKGTSDQGNILLNDKKTFTFDATKNKVFRKIKITLVAQYYIILDIENPLTSPVTLNLESIIPDMQYIQEPSERSYTINPGTKSQVLSFTYSSFYNKDISQDAILRFMSFSGITKQGDRVLLNDEESLKFDATRTKVTKKVKISMTKYYYITLDIENSLGSPVTLYLKPNNQNLRYQQEPPGMTYTIPSVKSDGYVLTFKFASSSGDDVMSQFMTFQGTSGQGNVLLNNQQSLTFDATQDKRTQRIKISFDDKPKDLDGFTYYFTLTPINNYRRPLAITFTPSINAGYIQTQPKTFHISGDGNPRKPDITFSLKSTRELTNQELKALIVVDAQDAKTKDPVQVNKKDSLAINGGSRDPKTVKPIEATFSVKEYAGHLPFNAISMVEDQTIILQWIPKNGLRFPNAAPRELELTYQEDSDQDIYFSFKTLSMYNDVDLFVFKAKNKNTNKQLLVNGKQTFESGMGTFNRENPLRLIVSDVKGNNYYTNLRVENTLGYDIFFGWKPRQSNVGSSFFITSPKTYQLNAGQTKSYTLRGGSTAPLSNDQLKDALDIYAYRLDDFTGERRYLGVNNEQNHFISLSRDENSRSIYLKIAEPREYRYVMRFQANNRFSRHVTLSWKYQNPDQEILSSNSPNDFKVDGNLEKKMVEFTSSKPLSMEDLRSMVYFQARADGVSDLTINDQDKFYVTLSRYDEKLGQYPDVSKLNIYKKGFASKRYINLIFNNVESYPITVSSNKIISDDLIYSNNPKTFTVYPGASKRVSFVFWSFNQDSLTTDRDMTSLTANAHQQPIMLNGNRKYFLNTNILQRKSDNDEYTPITLSAPKEFTSNVEFIVSNSLSFPVQLKWKLSDPRITITSASQPTIQPSARAQKVLFTFKSKTPLSPSELNNLMTLSGISVRDNQPVLLNGKSALLISPRSSADEEDVQSIPIRISLKENRFPVNLKVSNNLAYPIKFNARFPAGSPYTIISRPSYEISSGESKTLSFYISGPSRPSNFGLIFDAEPSNGVEDVLLVNEKRFFNLNETPRKGDVTDISVSKGKSYSIQFVVDNQISDLVDLKWRFVNQQPESQSGSTGEKSAESKDLIFVQPRSKKNFRYNFDDELSTRSSGDSRTIQVFGQDSSTEIQVLLNKKPHLNFDLDQENISPINIVITSYQDKDKDSKAIDYPIKIRLSNNGINQPYILRWNFQIVDDSLSSDSPKEFTIDPSKQDSQEVDLVIRSTRPLDKDEIKNMLSFQAVDRSTEQPFLINNEFIFTPDMVLVIFEQNPESPKTESFKIQPLDFTLSQPRELRYVLNFNAFNNGQEEATLSWEIADRNIANYLRPSDPSPKTYTALPNRNVQYNVEFISSKPIDADTLKKAIRVGAKDSNGQDLLVNGKSNTILVLQPFGYSPSNKDLPNEGEKKPRQDIVISKSAKDYYVNLNIINQLQSPVLLSWRYALVMDNYKLFTNEKPVQMGADSNKKVSLRFGAPSVDQPLPDRNLIVLYATSQDDQSSDSGALLINGSPTLSVSLSELQGVNRMIVNISKPEENLYAVKLNIRNPMKTTAYIKWELNTDRYPDLKLAQTISKQEMSIQPGDNTGLVLRLQMPASVKSPSQMKNAIIFRVSHGPWKNPAFLNVKKQLPTDLHLTTNPKDLPDFPMTVSDIGYVYGVRFTIDNNFKKPIELKWRLNNDDKNSEENRPFFTDNSKSYTIQPGTKKDILLQLRFDKPISKEDLKSLVVLTSTFPEDQNMVLLNGEEKLPVQINPLKENDKPKAMVVQPSLPTRNSYTVSFRIINPLETPAIVSWAVRRNLPKIYFSSPKEIAVGPKQNILQTIKFTIADSLDPQTLLNLLQMTVMDQQSRKSLLINGEKEFKADFQPHGATQPEPQQIVIARQVYPHFIWILIDNQYNTPINIQVQLLNKETPAYMYNPDTYTIGKGSKRILKIPVLYLEQAQPDQLQGIVGITAQRDDKTNGKLPVNGERIFVVDLVSGDYLTKNKPVDIVVAPQSDVASKVFTLVNTLPEEVILTPRFYPNPDSEQQPSSGADPKGQSRLTSYSSKDGGENRVPAFSQGTNNMRLELKKGECMELNAKSTEDNQVLMINDKPAFVVCDVKNMPSVVMSKKDSKISVIAFIVDNKWNKEIIAKQTIISSGEKPSNIKEYNIDASKKTEFLYLSSKLEDLTSSSKFQFVERETGLLITLPNGEDHIYVNHQPYRQDFTVLIENANKITVQRPSYIKLDITSLIGQSGRLFIKDITGRTLKEIDFKSGQRKLNAMVSLSYESFPFMHYVTGKMADGRPIYVNGKEQLGIIPSLTQESIPIFLSDEADSEYAPTTYYLDLTIQNKWSNTVYMASPLNGEITTIILKPGQTKHKLFVVSADKKPDARYFKVIDQDVGNLMKINGESEHVLLNYHSYLKPITIVVQDYGEVTSHVSYFAIAKLMNRRNEPTIVKFHNQIIKMSPQQTQYVMSRMMIGPTTARPKPVRVTATNVDLVPVSLNDQNVFEVVPTFKQRVVPIIITRPNEEKETFKDTIFSFVNTLDNPSQIFINNKPYITIPPKFYKQIKLDRFMGETIQLTARDENGEKQFFINGTDGLRLFSNKLKSMNFIIHSKDTELSPSDRPYFFNVLFKNHNPQPIAVKWIGQNTEDTIIGPGDVYLYRDIVLSPKQPKDVTFKVIDTNTGREVSLNGQDSFTIKPSTLDDMKINHFVINPESPVNLGFANLAFINTLPYTVNVRLNSQSWRIPARSYVERKVQQVAGDTRLQFEVTNTNGGKEFMNGFYGTVYLNLDGTEGSKRKALYIGQKSSETGWADQAVLHLKLTFNNKRSSPLRIVSKIDNRQQSTIVQPNSKHLIQDILVRLAINDDVIEKETSFQFFDEETGNQLLIGGKRKLDLPYQLVGENVYRVIKAFDIDEKTQHIYGYRQIELDVFNKNAESAKMTYTQNGEKVPFTVDGNSNRLITFEYPMYSQYERLSIATKQLLDINGRGQSFQIPFSKDVYAMIFLTKKPIDGRLTSFQISNTLNEPITIRWLLKDIRKSTNIPAGGHKIFYFYLPKDTQQISLSAVSSSSNKPVMLGGEDVYQIPLGEENERPSDNTPKSIVVSDPDSTKDEDKSPKSPSTTNKPRFISIHFVNRENKHVLIKFHVPSDRSIQIAPVLIDAKSTRRAYIQFPNGVENMVAQAFHLDQMLRVNGRPSMTLRPRSVDQFEYVVIERPELVPKEQQVDVDVRNNLNEEIIVHWIESGEKKSTTIPANDRGVALVTKGDQPIRMQATTKDGRPVYINGQNLFTLDDSQPSGKNRVFVQTGKEIGEEQPYYNYLQMKNVLPNDVNLFWQWRGIGYITKIPANSLVFLRMHVRREDALKDFSFTAQRNNDRSRVMLNGQRRFVTRPNRVPSYRMVELSADEIGRPYRMVLNAVNKLPVPINLLWEQDGVKNVLYVQPGDKVTIDQPVANKNKIILTAFEAGTSNSVLVNGAREFSLNPSSSDNTEEPSPPQDINLTQEPSIYFYRLYVTDQSGMGRPTTIQWLVDGQVTETIRLPSNADRYPITKRFSLKPGQKVQIRAFNGDKANPQQLYVNERLTFDPNQVTSNYHGDAITIGEPISRRLYYFRLLVSNLNSKFAVLKWDLPAREGVITHSRIIPAFYFNYVVFANVEAYEQPSEITLTSYVNGTKQQLYTNDQKSFPVNAVSQKRPTFYKIYISRQVTIRNETMLFNNPTNEDIQVTWQTFGNRGTTIVPAKSTNYRVPVSLTGGFRSQSILLRAQNIDGEKALINSNRVINIRLPRNKPFIIDYPYKNIIFNNSLSSDVTIKGVPGGIMQTIRAGEDINFRIALRTIPKSGITFTAVNQLDDTPTKINGKDSVVMRPDNLIARYSIGAIRPISREYFIKLWLTNNHTNNVALKWTEGSWQRVFAFQPNFNGETVLSFNSDAPVTLSGNDVNTNNYVYLNRRQELVIRPTSSVKYATNVVISGEIALYDYFYRLIVNNERNTDVDIVLKSPKETTRSDVPALRFKYTINTPLFNLDLGPKQPIQIYAFMKDGTPLYVNGKDYVDVLPSLNDDEATVINVGKEIPRRLFFYSFQVSSPVGKDVILRYQLPDGVSRLTRIPAPSKDRKEFYSVIIPYKSMKHPSPVVVYAYDENDNKPMLINGVKSLTVEPSNNQNREHVVYITETDTPGSLPARGPEFEYNYIGELVNPNSQAVQLTWTQGGQTQDFRVEPNSKTEISFKVKQNAQKPIPVELRASSVDGKSLPLNQVSVYYLKPSEAGDKVPVIHIGHIAQFVVYVTNNLNVDGELQHQVGDKTQKYSVKANAVRSEIMIKNPSVDSEHQFTAFSAMYRRSLAINQKSDFIFSPRNVQPNSQGLITLNLDISGLTVYYVIQVENMQLYPVTLAWTLDGRRGFQQLGGKSNSKLVIRNENPQSEKPGPIAISCYRPTRDRRIPMYINNKKTFTANPVYDIDTAQRAVISADLEPTRQNFIRFDVTNYVNNDVALYWSQGGEIDFERSTNFRRINAGQQNKQIKISFPLQQTGQVQIMAYDSANRQILRLNNRQRLFIQPTENANVMRVIITEKASALSDPQNTYYFNLQIKNYNQNPIQLQYRQAGSDGSFQRIDIPALYHQWFYLPFNRIENFPMSVHFRVYDTVDRRYVSIVDYGGMYLWQPTGRYSTEQLTVGNTIPKKIYNNPLLPENADGFPYFLSLHVWNRGERNTRLYWNEPGSSRRRYLSIPANSFREYTYVVRSKSQLAPWIRISVERITEGGRSYRPLIDGYKSLDAVRLQRTKRTHFLFIEHQRQKNVRYYRYGIQFINMASHDVLFKWNENNIQRKQYVRPLSSAYFYGVMSVPKDGSSVPNLRIEAFNPATNERVLLNGDEYASFEVFEKMRLKTVYVESNSPTMRMRSYFMGYDVTNLYPEPVIMKWREGDQDRTMVVPPDGSMYYDTSLVSSSRPAAFPVSATFQKSGKPAPIYGQMNYNVQWSPYRRRHSILIGNLDSPQKVSKPTEYQLAFKLKNIAQVPLTVKWTENGVQKSANIDPGRKQQYTISVKSYTEPPQLVFRVYKQGTDQLGTINGQMTLEAQPTENSLVSLWTLNYGALTPGELQKNGQRCGDILDVAILLDSSGTMRGGYSHAKEFIKTFADYYHLGANSTHIGVISFSEKAHLHVPFNAHQEHLLFNEDIDQIPFYGYRTRLDLAFKMADTRLYEPQYGARDNAEKIVLLITDGRQNDGDISKEKLRLASQASQGLLNKNVKITAIGLYGTSDPDENMLTILTGSKDRVHVITEYEQLYSNSFLEALTDDIC